MLFRDSRPSSSRDQNSTDHVDIPLVSLSAPTKLSAISRENEINGSYSDNEPDEQSRQGLEPPDQLVNTSKHPGQKIRSAWRFTVKSGALGAGIVLLVNLVTLIVVYTRFDTTDAVAALYLGSCDTSSRITVGLHIIINVLSTILLAYSNYAMQCMSSPTRTEIDQAHAKSVWLSIATPNIRNLFFVSPNKAVLWVVLALSSFPLHLLWNAVVFQTQTTNDYLAISVTEGFLNGTTWSLPGTNGSSPQNVSIVSDVITRLQSKAQSNLLERLSNEDCIRAYGKDRQEDRRHLLLVSSSSDLDTSSATYNSSNPVLAVYSSPFTYASDLQFHWMCGFSVDTADQFIDGSGWECPLKLIDQVQSSTDFKWIPGVGDFFQPPTIKWGDQNNASVEYCYSEQVNPQCKVSVVPSFLIFVTVCNALKIMALVLSLHITRHDAPLVTTGDAVQSFLERPDTFTRGRCLVAKYDYEKWFGFGTSKEWRFRPSYTADLWQGGRYRLGKAVGNLQWTVFMLTISTAIILAGAFYGVDGVGFGTTGSGASILSLGIGEPHANFVLADDLSYADLSRNTPLGPTIMANIPQVVVSYLYLAFGNILTCMLAMSEYCSYAASQESNKPPAKGLRVSTPQKGSEQRSTFFLSVPYRWAIPTLLSITTVHWLVSQMVFIARIEVFDFEGTVDIDASVINIFFSPLAMLFAVSLGSAMILTLVFVGVCMRYPTHVPLAGNCSASIAAACQPVAVMTTLITGQKDFVQGLALRKLRWGVTSYDERGVGHATFDDGEVECLVVGNHYA